MCGDTDWTTKWSKTMSDKTERLLAAAPELLDACEALLASHALTYVGNGWQCRLCGRNLRSVIDFPHAAGCPILLARAAVAKSKNHKYKMEQNDERQY